MKRILKYFGFILAAITFMLVCAASFVSVRGIPSYEVPDVPAQQVALTPERIAQGEKIALAMCADCHLNRAAGAFTGKQLNELPPEFGHLFASNITQDRQHGIGTWTDAELIGLLRTGIGPDGRYRVAMPTLVHMSDEDISSVVAFLRSSSALVQARPVPSHEQQPSFLVKLLANTVMKPKPLPTATIATPASTDQVALGRYLVTGRYMCYDCHSADFKTNDALEPEKSEGYMGGGNEFNTPTGESIVSRNLTADPETGIGDWTEAEFVRAVKFGQSPHGPVRLPMPKFTVMSDEEAKAIFAYLQTIPKLKHAMPASSSTDAVATR